MNVIVNTDEINNFLDVIQNPSTTTNNEFVQLLSSANQNVIGQVVSSLSQQFNQMNSQSLDNAVSSKSTNQLSFIYLRTIICFRWHSIGKYRCIIIRKSSYSTRSNV